MSSYGSGELYGSWHGYDSKTVLEDDGWYPPGPNDSPFASQPRYRDLEATSIPIVMPQSYTSGYPSPYTQIYGPETYAEPPTNNYFSYTVGNFASPNLSQFEGDASNTRNQYHFHGLPTIPTCPASPSDSILSQPMTYSPFEPPSPITHRSRYILESASHQSGAMVNEASTLPNFPPATTYTHAGLRCNPALTIADDDLQPRRQPPRFPGDEYTATWIRGEGPDRAGWCGICSTWYKLKDSAYWYHMHYSHGISCATGKSFDHPSARRHAQGAVGYEALCSGCNQWIYIGRMERWQTPYYRHAYKCQMKRRPAVERSRSGTKSASPRKGNARPLRSV